MRKIIFITLVLTQCFCYGYGNTKSNQFERTIDKIVLKQKNDFNIPGIVVGLIMKNELVYAKGFGVQSLETNVDVGNHSLFHMASISKTFVATAVFQLIEAGKLNLDGTLSSYLPYFKLADDRYKNITIRHILTHSSGIPDVKDYEWDKPQYDDKAAERYVKTFIDKKLKFEPGDRFNYSNAGYDILAAVISKVSGVSFEEYMKNNIFLPIGMTKSTFLKKEVPGTLATAPHVLDNDLEMAVSDVYPYNRIHAPSSTLHSNIHDMLLWAKMYLNQGKIGKKELLKKETYNMLTSPQISIGRGRNMCFGWHEGQFNKKKMYYHTGGDTGFSTYFGFIPEDSIAIVVMGNNRLYWGGNPAYQILNKLLLHKDVDYWKKPVHLELGKYILTDGIEVFKKKYFIEKEKNPGKYQFGESCLDELGYWLIERKHFKKALNIFKFNVELFPENARWHDSVGDAYKALGKFNEAIKWYKSALKINPKKKNTLRKLEELKKQGQKQEREEMGLANYGKFEASGII